MLIENIVLFNLNFKEIENFSNLFIFIIIIIKFHNKKYFFQ
jgi:hypothetical protein